MELTPEKMREFMRGPSHKPTVLSPEMEHVPIVSFEVGKGLPQGAEMLVPSVITELKDRGYKVANIIRSNQREVDAGDDEASPNDLQGTTDTLISAYAQAGSEKTLIVTAERADLTKQTVNETELEDMVAALGDGYDVIIGEGFRFLPIPKILLTDKPADVFMLHLPKVIAYISEGGVNATIPGFAPSDVKAIADKIENDIIKSRIDRQSLMDKDVAVPEE